MIRFGSRSCSCILACLLVARAVRGQPAPAPSSPVPSDAPSPPPLSPPGAPSSVDVAPPTPALTEPAFADEPRVREPAFGDKGEVVISGAFTGNLGHLGYSDSNASTFSASLEPSVDYFVAKNVSVGAAGFISYNEYTTAILLETKSVGVGIYGRLGLNAPLGEFVSFRPVVSLGAWHLSSTISTPGPGYTVSLGGSPVATTGAATDVSQTVVVVEIFAPILVHPARHFFLGLGPDVYTDLSNDIGALSNKRTFLGLSSTVGGWF